MGQASSHATNAAGSDAERLRARQAMLGNLSAALHALVRKLGAQREVAIGACSLAPRAEEIAKRARVLAFGRGRLPPQALAELVEAIEEMASEAAAVSGEIERGAAMGGRIVVSIGAQLSDLAAISRDPVRLADPGALRGVLTGLATTLKDVSAQRHGEDAGSQGVLELGRRSAALARRARELASSGQLHQEILAMSRELGAYATDAVRVATTLAADATQAEKVLEAMAGEIRSIAQPAAATRGPEVDMRLASMLREGQKASSGEALNWGVAGRAAG